MKHIGFIMDGNRRWAKKLKNIAIFGHEKGLGNIENILSLCLEARIEIVSMWALSRENIAERSKAEIEGIYTIIRKQFPELIRKLREKGVIFETVWDLWLLPEDIRAILLQAMDDTKNGKNMTFVLAIWYSGQDEIIRAVRRFIAEAADPQTLTPKSFLDYLDTGKYPPPDLIVRTGGNIRHSGYFLYQSAYSEYYFTDTFWPDFWREDFEKALQYFESVQRNFWK
jgi:undecaprenyl diphosphate synthase